MEIRAIAVSQKDEKAVVLLRSEDGAAPGRDWLQCQVVIDWTPGQPMAQMRQAALARLAALTRELTQSAQPAPAKVGPPERDAA